MSGPGLFWDGLRRRIWVQGRLVAGTGLHIGDGRRSASPTTLDDAVVRDAEENPYIPGSSLKGALRAFLERVAANGWLKGGDVSSCAHTMGQREWDKRVGKLGSDPEAIYAALCPVCRLMGAPHFAGRLQVRDLPAVPGTGPGRWEDGGRLWRVRLAERNGVGINRETGTAAGGVLYDFEVVPPGTAFDLALLLENPTEDEWHNTLVGLVALSRGDIPLGGKVTRGLGRVTLEDVGIYDLSLENGHLRRYVLGTPLADLPYQSLSAAAASAFGGDSHV